MPIGSERAAVQNLFVCYAEEQRKAALQSVFQSMLHQLMTEQVRVEGDGQDSEARQDSIAVVGLLKGAKCTGQRLTGK